MRQIWLAVVLLTAFIIATIDLADARDKSGVLKASDLIGKKVQNIGWEEAWGHQGSGHQAVIVYEYYGVPLPHNGEGPTKEGVR